MGSKEKEKKKETTNMILSNTQVQSTKTYQFLALLIFCVFSASAFSGNSCQGDFRKSIVLCSSASPSDSANSRIHDTRRNFFGVAGMSVLALGAGVPSSIAADSPLPPGTKYISGKTPLAPGEVKKKSDNTKGTRKDPDFLRSIADCRNQCQGAPGSDGLAKSKEDCLSECQDICCKTYEQCTFNIVPRL